MSYSKYEGKTLKFQFYFSAFQYEPFIFPITNFMFLILWREKYENIFIYVLCNILVPNTDIKSALMVIIYNINTYKDKEGQFGFFVWSNT